MKSLFAEAIRPLELHPKKSRFLPTGEALDHIRDAALSYVTGDNDDSIDPSTAEKLLVDAATQTPVDVRRARFALKALGRRRSPLGIGTLEGTPAVFRETPKDCGDYLSTLTESRRNRKRLDADWLADLVVSAPESPTDYGVRIHAARPLAKLGTSSGTAQRLERALDHRDNPYPATRAWAAACLARAKKTKTTALVDCLEAEPNHSVRRVLARPALELSGRKQPHVIKKLWPSTPVSNLSHVW
ncbi:MAG: hypothetical protein M5U31_16215 [Acidimicrobiia bacterium]|nr:hypothetical protein [Acidimicrobiia bacterium]